jgi:hypothetical protein
MASVFDLVEAGFTYWGDRQAQKAQETGVRRATGTVENQMARAKADLGPYSSAGYAALGEQRSQLGLRPESEDPVRFGFDPNNLSPTQVKALTDVQEYFGVDPINNPENFTAMSYGELEGKFQRRLRNFSSAFGYDPTAVNWREASAPREPAPTAEAQPEGKYGAFEESPGYQFAFDEGMRALEKLAVSRGRSRSGGLVREAQRYAAGLAGQEYGNYYDRLRGLSQQGQQAVNVGVDVGQRGAENVGSLQTYLGELKGAGQRNRASAIAGGVRAAGEMAGGPMAALASRATSGIGKINTNDPLYGYDLGR